MTPLRPEHKELLDRKLKSDFVPCLPALLDTARPSDEQDRKNLSRAFGAFALHGLLGISAQDAANSVVDDYDDFGIDAIYYYAQETTLYLVQAKHKETEMFSQTEALAFTQGVRKLVTQHFNGFNGHVMRRQTEIEGSLEDCSKIQLVIAHVGSGVSAHAKTAVDDFINAMPSVDDRIQKTVVDYDAACVLRDIREGYACAKINPILDLENSASISTPKETYFGLIQLDVLAQLHAQEGEVLYDKNIRNCLGGTTAVNTAIYETLATNPENFVYLNNGVTAICAEISPKGTSPTRQGKMRLHVKGFSVVNGAQTIATTAKYKKDNPGGDISSAKVAITLIKTGDDSAFEKSITRARNHQNPVQLANFAALDDEQERLRKDLAALGIRYVYKAGETESTMDPKRIHIGEAVQALSALHGDPRYAVWMKTQPGELLNTESSQYKELFTSTVTPHLLWNSVIINRYIQKRVQEEVDRVSGQERLSYKHGAYCIAWIYAKKVLKEIKKPKTVNETKINSSLSASFDQLRQSLWDHSKTVTVPNGVKGPLAFFRSMTDTIPLLKEIMIDYFELATDVAIQHKSPQQTSDEPYPRALFEYIISKAPQVEDLT
jgi:hypothetical protein